MRTNWDDAPEWAEFKTFDRNGMITYWEKEPVPGIAHWMPRKVDPGRWLNALEIKDFRIMIEKRPPVIPSSPPEFPFDPCMATWERDHWEYHDPLDLQVDLAGKIAAFS